MTPSPSSEQRNACTDNDCRSNSSGDNADRVPARTGPPSPFDPPGRENISIQTGVFDTGIATANGPSSNSPGSPALRSSAICLYSEDRISPREIKSPATSVGIETIGSESGNVPYMPTFYRQGYYSDDNEDIIRTSSVAFYTGTNRHADTSSAPATPTQRSSEILYAEDRISPREIKSPGTAVDISAICNEGDNIPYMPTFKISQSYCSDENEDTLRTSSSDRDLPPASSVFVLDRSSPSVFTQHGCLDNENEEEEYCDEHRSYFMAKKRFIHRTLAFDDSFDEHLPHIRRRRSSCESCGLEEEVTNVDKLHDDVKDDGGDRSLSLANPIATTDHRHDCRLLSEANII